MWTSVSPCPVPRERTRRDAHRHVPPRAHPRCSRVRVPQKTLVLHAVAHTAQAVAEVRHIQEAPSAPLDVVVQVEIENTV